MLSDREALFIIENRDFERIYNQVNNSSLDIIKKQIQSIPSSFYEQTIPIDSSGQNKISIVQFSLQMAGISDTRRKGLMEKYHINPYDIQKLQRIVDEIKIATECGKIEKTQEIQEMQEEAQEEKRPYGFSLSSNAQIDKAYPLWVAYLCSDSINPLFSVKNKLKEDGVEDKYNPEMIVRLIDHANDLMHGKSEEERRDFFIHSISTILDDTLEVEKKEEIEI